MNNLSNEEKKAIDKLKAGEKIGIYELIRTFKREGIENFVTTRKKYVDTILNLIENQQKEIEELKENYIRLQNTEAIQDIYIKKDKIKAKIEELEKQDRESRMSHNYLVIPVLQELLEEE